MKGISTASKLNNKPNIKPSPKTSPTNSQKAEGKTNPLIKRTTTRFGKIKKMVLGSKDIQQPSIPEDDIQEETSPGKEPLGWNLSPKKLPDKWDFTNQPPKIKNASPGKKDQGAIINMWKAKMVESSIQSSSSEESENDIEVRKSKLRTN